jgi:hypothetical protein
LNGHRAIVGWGILGLAPLLIGCRHGTTLDRLPVHGTITLPNNEKLNDASINFKPPPGHDGPTANAMVTDGIYQFDSQNGPTAGPQIVTITRIRRRTSNAEATAAPKKSVWTQKVELSDDKVYVQDFQLD